MNNKYYTPEIEELLNVLINKESIYRLEYDKIIEIKSYDNIEDTLYNFIKMNNCQWKYDFENKIIKSYSINTNMYLLKYLDEQDILDLGFKEDTYNGVKCFTKNNCQIFYFAPQTHIISIDCFSDNYRQTYFKGLIKNKSELKQILKMIGHGC